MALKASQLALQRLCLKELGCDLSELASLAYLLQEAGAREWGNVSEKSPSGATLLSSAMVTGALEGIVRPKIVDRARELPPAKVFIAGIEVIAGRNQVVESMIDGILAKVPWPADCQAVLQVLDLVDTSSGADVRRGLLEALCQDAVKRTSKGGVGAVALARQVAEGSARLAEELRAHQLLPDWLNMLCKISEGQGGGARGRSVEPILIVAHLPEPVAGLAVLLVEYLGKHPANWASIRPVFTHLERLASVAEFVGLSTLEPESGALRRLRLDLSIASSYDSQLQREYEERGEGQKSIRQLMKGFRLFCELLDMARDYGAPIDCLPRGLPKAVSARKWESVRPDLTPDPEVYRRLLAMAPALVAEEDPKIARLLLLDLVIPSRPNAVLTMERRGWIEEEEGVVLNIRPGARHKRGRGTVFLAGSLRALYGIEPDWLPIEADEQPSVLATNIYGAMLRRVLGRFCDSTGLTLPIHAYISRRGLLQLLRKQVSYPDIAVATAFLDHESATTRANYLRPTHQDLIEALGKL